MRIFWHITGGVFLALAVIGAFLPVMPTVPFLLVAAWAFAKSSPALRERILNNPLYGPQVRAWQERGAVGRMAKIWAVSAMATGVAMALYLALPLWVVAVQATICLTVSAYLISRPER